MPDTAMQPVARKTEHRKRRKRRRARTDNGATPGRGRKPVHPAYEAEPLRAAGAQHVILFLAANPTETDWLALDREARAIHAELKRSGHRDRSQRRPGTGRG